ncbi:MAG: metallophosphoesterase [Xanthobacteraceae bacterium]
MTSPGTASLEEGEASDRVLAFAHIGDLHLTDAKQQNFLDMLAIVAQIEAECADRLDFVVLPGDNADNGLPAQYTLAATALKMLSVPVHAIPADHDMEHGGLAAFHAGLAADLLPKALTVRGSRCLFLDICGPGGGGPDFRVGTEQATWFERELHGARAGGQTSVVFMHNYPDDLKGEGETEALNRLVAAHDVALVDMGRTHYNELANDGRTVFAATRSTGQIEEGPVGYSIATLDGGVVSWRFKALADAFPFVVITAPADHRLMRGAAQAVDDSCEVRALVFGGRHIERVECQADDGQWSLMTQANGRIWSGRLPIPGERLVTLMVRAVDATGRPGQHTIRAATHAFVPPVRSQTGSDAASIGAWPENGIPGTQLGPNRNAKPK